jgi:hypothetical protein
MSYIEEAEVPWPIDVLTRIGYSKREAKRLRRLLPPVEAGLIASPAWHKPLHFYWGGDNPAAAVTYITETSPPAKPSASPTADTTSSTCSPSSTPSKPLTPNETGRRKSRTWRPAGLSHPSREQPSTSAPESQPLKRSTSKPTPPPRQATRHSKSSPHYGQSRDPARLVATHPPGEHPAGPSLTQGLGPPAVRVHPAHGTPDQ